MAKRAYGLTVQGSRLPGNGSSGFILMAPNQCGCLSGQPKRIIRAAGDIGFRCQLSRMVESAG